MLTYKDTATISSRHGDNSRLVSKSDFELKLQSKVYAVVYFGIKKLNITFLGVHETKLKKLNNIVLLFIRCHFNSF